MKIIRICFKFTLSLFILGFISICAIYVIAYLAGAPAMEQQDETVLYDMDGDVLVYNQSDNDFTELDAVSPYLLEATVLTEDKHFYSHHGFDFPGIFRAITKNIRNSRLKEGASTITQQLARNLYLNHDKTWIRKIKEAFFTIRLEMFYTKDEILTHYLNTIYYGHGAYGIDAASNLFFDKSADKLSIAEAAMLAGIPKGPTYYSPFNDEKKAFERQGFILKLLLSEKVISTAEYHQARAEELEFIMPDSTSTFAMHYHDLVLREASDILGSSREAILHNGYQIYTTLDTERQQALEEIISKKISPDSQLEIGVVALHAETGAISALIGGNPHINSPYNRATDARRMVGSTFKPFVYYTALEQGFTPTTMLLSEPTTFKLAENDFYKPQNYNGYYAQKPITLAQAIAVSDNIYAVKTGLYLTPTAVIDTTRKLGITSKLPNVASLALGSAAISVDEMVTAYGIIANGGNQISSYTIEKITDKQGKVIYEHPQPADKHILQAQKAFLLTHLMTGMFDSRLGGNMHVTGASIKQQLSRVYAGKSGTTDFDSWMIGYSPETVAGVWVGYDDNRAMTNVADGSVAKQVWAAFMETASEQEQRTNFRIPPNITWRMIDPETGLIATENCAVNKLMYFEKGTEPTQTCQHQPFTTEEAEAITDDGLFQKLWQLLKRN